MIFIKAMITKIFFLMPPKKTTKNTQKTHKCNQISV